jgi:enediyne biosynthesis protein E4
MGSSFDWQEGHGYQFREIKPPSSDGRLGRGRESGRAGFKELPASRAGINFTNVLPREVLARNHNFMNGSGVAAGDFDGDGWIDLYFSSINGSNALYRNLGGWRFEEVTEKAGVGLAGYHSTGAVFADLNGNGRLDLLVSTLGQGVRCFYNEGEGRFREATREAGLFARAGSTSLALADLNGNGFLDLYVANYGEIPILRSGGRASVRMVDGEWVVVGPHANRLRFIEGRLIELGEPDVLYFNDGTGRFTPAPWNSEYFLDEDGRPVPEPWDFGLSAQIRDINGNGLPDIYVCNDFQTVDRIWLNDGEGRFRALPRLAMRKQSYASMGVDFADVDRDGVLDFFVVEMLSRDHSLRMRQMISMPPQVPVPGRIDNRPQAARNTFFRGLGDGAYAELANFSGLAATDWSWQPVFLDVDLDGYEDLLVVNGMAFDILDRDTLQQIQMLGRQTPEQSRATLFLYPPFRSPNVALRNRGDLTFEEASAAWNFNSTRISHGIALADLDNDGDLDVIINCLNDGPLLYRNETTAPRVAARLKGLPPNTQGIGSKIKLFGGAVPVQSQEVICGGRYLSGDDPMRVFAAGTLTNRMRIEVEWRSGNRSVIENVLPNHLYEIEEPAATPILSEHGGTPQSQIKTRKPEMTTPLFRDASHLLQHEHREIFFNDYLRQPLLMKQLSQLGPGVAWVDLTGDGQDELVIGAGKGGTLGIFKMTSNQFEQLPLATGGWTAPDDTSGLAAWVSSEGTPGLLTGLANYESPKGNEASVLRLSFQQGAVRISHVEEIDSRDASTGPLAVADMDGNGELDLFAGGRVIPGAYPAAAASRVYRQRSGRLVLDEANSALLKEAGLVSGAVWSDLDDDGYPELILACEWGPIRIFRNQKGKLTPWDPRVKLARALSDSNPRWVKLGDLTGWWHGVTTGDFDGDGLLDIVAGNWGLNDAYQASLDRPLGLYFGNLAGHGMVDLIESYYVPELEAEAPRRAFSALSQAFPTLAPSYPNHHSFSLATIPDLLGRLPARPRKVTATTLASMLFLNRGDHFLAVPLPVEAQLAPTFSLNVADADGDGREDLFLSQNFFSMRPEWPRLDGGRGLWLRGDGQGGFKPLPSHESGIAVYGEQRGAAVADFNGDGRIDLAVTQNGAATLLFENVGARPGLRLRLEGPPGNPWGIGGIIRLQFGDHLSPAREIKAGSGYWSQDSIVQVLGCPEPPDAIHVLWPGGIRSTYAVPADTRQLVVLTLDPKKLAK